MAAILLTLAVAAVAAGGANAQFRSYMGSTSLVAGQDGRMHQELHEVHKTVEMSGPMTQSRTSEVICVDGRCKENDMISITPQQQAMPRAFLRGYLRDLLTHVRVAAPPPQQKPKEGFFIIGGAPQEEEPQNGLIIIGAPWRMRPRLQKVQVQAAAGLPTQHMPVLVAVIAGLAAATLSFLVAALLKVCCVGSRSSSARGVSLTRALAKPFACDGALVATLAPAPVKAAAVPGPADTPFHRKPSVGTWLCQRLPEVEEA